MLSVRLVAAKAKVAPIHSVSIPRLELIGACLGNKLTQSVTQLFLIPIKEVVFWSDSTNVLWWIKGHSTVYKPSVANRISEIQSCTNPSQWRYVPTELNPADYLTRGLRVSNLIERKSWWEGLHYLHDTKDNWPKKKLPPVSDEAKQEVKRVYFELNSQPEFMDGIGSWFDGADTTMVTIDKSNQT